jgi:hypothetical protein
VIKKCHKSKKDFHLPFLSSEQDPSLPLLSNYVLDCTTWDVQENLEGLEMNGTYQRWVYADDFKFLDETIKKNTQVLLDASKQVSKSMYRHQNGGR